MVQIGQRLKYKFFILIKLITSQIKNKIQISMHCTTSELLTRPQLTKTDIHLFKALQSIKLVQNVDKTCLLNLFLKGEVHNQPLQPEKAYRQALFELLGQSNRILAANKSMNCKRLEKESSSNGSESTSIETPPSKHR